MSKKRAPTALDHAETAFKQAERAAKQGDRIGADRWLKTAEKMSIVAERIAAANAAAPPPENIEEIRVELRARVARFVGVEHQIRDWEHQRDIRDALAAFAREHNLPEPPEMGPCPYTMEELELTGAGKYHPLPRQAPIVPKEVLRKLGRPIIEEKF